MLQRRCHCLRVLTAGRRVQNDAEEYLWEHCPRTVHRFAAFAQRLDDKRGVNAALKWRDIAVSASAACLPHLDPTSESKADDKTAHPWELHAGCCCGTPSSSAVLTGESHTSTSSFK